MATPAETYEPFDPDYIRDVGEKLVAPMFDHYFRAELIDADKLPRSGPLVLAANHSGNAFPWDAMVLDAMLWRRDGSSPGAKFRSVFEKELAFTWWMRPFGLDNFWRRGGGVDMTFDNFDRLLARGERVAYYPEGVPGIGKGFFRRYQLQEFKTSFVVLAAKHRAPIHPCYIVNAEWVLPLSFTIGWLNRFFDRVFHVPFVPFPAIFIGIVFPWAWYLSLPVHMKMIVGDPIDVRAMVEEAGVERFDRSEHEKFAQVAERIRALMQLELSRLVERHGRRPFGWRSLLRELWRSGRRLWRVLPTGWPIAFVRHDRDRHRPPARNFLHRWLRDWDLIGFYLPFGWPLLTLARRFRKPPCGYRGLSKEEARRRQGAFVWHLADRPLPPRPPPAA